MKDLATPRPWANPEKCPCGDPVCNRYTLSDVVNNSGLLWRKDAELIVRCVNTHDQLVEALEIISKIAYDVPWGKYDEFNLQSLWLAIEQARAALKSAKQ
jgi:hypothetical protein